MKIDIAIHSSDSNPLYLDFWPSVSRAWKKLNIEPVLLYLDNNYENATISEEYGRVIRIKPLPSIPIYVQCQVIRYWYATQLNSTIGIISDIDMYPLSRFYFKTQLEAIPNDKYVHLNPCMATYGNVPACYNVASGSTYSKVLGNVDFATYINKTLSFAKSVNSRHEDKLYWFADEKYSTMRIENYPDKSLFHFIPREGGQNGHRIDRIAWSYDKNLISQGYYYDAHSIRPFSQYADELNEIVSLI